jgi:hypothetical protein
LATHLAEDGGVNERVAPEQVADARMRPDERADSFMWDEGDLARDHCSEAVVHDLQVDALQVGNVARDVERVDLALAAGHDLVTAGEAFKQRAALRRPVLLAYDVLVRLEVAPARQRR